MYCNYVKEFSELGAVKELPKKPEKMTTKEIKFLCKMVAEELAELKEANTIGEQADALIDAIYYILDAGVKKGIDLDPIFKIIHKNNMTKVKNKNAIRREGGKVEKPEGFQNPDELIEAEIKRQTEKEEAQEFYSIFMTDFGECCRLVTQSNQPFSYHKKIIEKRIKKVACTLPAGVLDYCTKFFGDYLRTRHDETPFEVRDLTFKILCSQRKKNTQNLEYDAYQDEMGGKEEDAAFLEETEGR